MRLINSLILSLVFVFTSGCDLDEDTFEGVNFTSVSNTPIVASSDSGYSYTLGLGDNFSTTRMDQLGFDNDIISFSLVVSQHTGGSGSLAFISANSDTLRIDQFDNNIVIGQDDLELVGLSSIGFNLEEFTGSVVVAISPR